MMTQLIENITIVNNYIDTSMSIIDKDDFSAFCAHFAFRKIIYRTQFLKTLRQTQQSEASYLRYTHKFPMFIVGKILHRQRQMGIAGER